MDSRYELLPFGAGPTEAAAIDEPLTFTITCSPRHGLDATVTVSEMLRERGHSVVPHVAAKMVRDRGHLDSVLQHFAEIGIDDVFLIGGDAPKPLGPFESAVALLPILHEHALRPKRIGVGAYPEGHPLIGPAALDEALGMKNQLADYVVTQMCFDPDVLVTWLIDARTSGLILPAYVGIPGAVDRRKLIEVSMRVGVGQSISFLRKQRGLRSLLGNPREAMNVLYDALAPRIGEPDTGIAGFHWYCFNRAHDTIAWEKARLGRRPGDQRYRSIVI
jgi:methylenetetrahydrofolate reductase (NADPH)